MASYCRIVLREATRSFDREYTYLVPAELKGKLAVGSRIEIPFGAGNRRAEAFVTAVMPEADSDFTIKPVLALLSDNPVLRPDQMHLAAQMRSRYLCTYGDALKCMVPAAVAAVHEKTVRMAELQDPAEAAQRLADGEIERIGQVRVIELLLDCGSAPLQEVMRACQVSRSVITTLVKKEWIRLYEQESLRQLPDEDHYVQTEPFEPNEGQDRAIKRINQAMRACEQNNAGCQEYVLFGITGSGKTEVYLQCARTAVDLGRGVIILVPEISLTPQMISRIRSRFGSGAAVLHSRLTPAERHDQWQRILRRDVQVVVGARSAIFAPLPDIGLIIIDEEQESSYKSETHPRYHARDIARLRAKEQGAVLILGSATPSVESFQRCETGQAIRLDLPERIGEAGLPQTTIVDMKQELIAGNRSIFSRGLRQALTRAFDAGHQAIIFLNRRGYAGFLLCRQCGHVVKCRSCSVSLTSHQNPHARPDDPDGGIRMICHYCGRITRPPRTCPVCGSERIGRFGAGTQQVEELFNQEFAPYRALRMDQDTTVGRLSHAKLLDQFARREADVLIGTQMIAKGHDFPNVTVVGILAADLMLGLSDFRAAERAFQLITQAAGRAGRGNDAGEVLIQAYNVDDYAVRYAAAQDYPGFFRQEIAYRRLMQYPPFGSICAMTLSAAQERLTRDKCLELASALKARRESEPAFQDILLMDPARAPIYQIKDRYRWRLVLKGPDTAVLAAFLSPVADRFDFGKTVLAMDMDPYNMM
ncbi:MAG: primosomal protein N' [Clostridiaceae bacterium]|nr:primosomal protein N' [Clostridiaceae bacterium]